MNEERHSNNIKNLYEAMDGPVKMMILTTLLLHLQNKKK